MTADEAMDTDSVNSQSDPAILTGYERHHAPMTVESLLQHGGVGPLSDCVGEGHVTPAHFEISLFGFDHGEVDELGHTLASDVPGVTVRYSLLCHALP
jgi:hypothetical protein